MPQTISQAVTDAVQNPAVEVLIDLYGPTLQSIDRINKLALLAVLSRALYFSQEEFIPDDDYENPIEDELSTGEYETIDDNLYSAVTTLDGISEDDALALCGALINQLRYGG
ncbi:MAG: hypothetical protein F6K19_33870 [Cyanothece sp. SIO1E1]|nr:hypothetical protein [Cyanothece sp. SIO1E1]